MDSYSLPALFTEVVRVRTVTAVTELTPSLVRLQLTRAHPVNEGKANTWQVLKMEDPSEIDGSLPSSPILRHYDAPLGKRTAQIPVLPQIPK